MCLHKKNKQEAKDKWKKKKLGLKWKSTYNTKVY